MSDTKIMVLNLLRAAAPERADEISALWSRYGPAVEVASGRSGIVMNANRHRIQFDIKTMEALWLIGFSGWKAIETYTPHVYTATLLGLTIDDVLVRDEQLGAYEMDYRHRIEIACSNIHGDDSGPKNWPPDIPQPTHSRELLDSTQDKVAFDLRCMATASVFLHEFRHVMYAKDGNAPSTLPEEELACDVWARGILTEKLAAYANANEHDFQQVLNKRAMAMALGSLILHVITPEHARWGTNEYPPIADRMDALVNGTNLPDNAHFWTFAASLLVGIMRQSHRSIDIIPDSARMLTEELISCLR